MTALAEQIVTSTTQASNQKTPEHRFSTFTGMEYLQIDVATQFGLGKVEWTKRLDWFRQNENNLENLIPQAEETCKYIAAVDAYRRARRGLPIGYGISMDATASGLQLLAVLTNCEKSARLCNVVPTGRREDAYRNLYDALKAQTSEALKVPYDQVKKAIMTAFYNSTMQPKLAFGEGKTLETFWRVLETEAPRAWALNKLFRKLWNPNVYAHEWVLPDNFHVSVPVEATMKRKVMFMGEEVTVDNKINVPTQDGLSLGPNMIHSVDGLVDREMSWRGNYDREQMDELRNVVRDATTKRFPVSDLATRKKDQKVKALWKHYTTSGFLSARIYQYLDHRNIGLTDPRVISKRLALLPSEPFEIVSVFDCFVAHPNDIQATRRLYTQILADISDSNLLNHLLTSLTGVTYNIRNPKSLSRKILNSDYALS